VENQFLDQQKWAELPIQEVENEKVVEDEEETREETMLLWDMSPGI
jgi:hypothetical protein